MPIDTQTIALIAIAAGSAGIGWAIFGSMNRRRMRGGSMHWDLVYVDENGVLQFTLVRVLHINLETRRLTAWCSRTGAERIFKLNRIVKATDVGTGRRIHMGRLTGKPRAMAAPAPRKPQASDDSGGTGFTTRQASSNLHYRLPPPYSSIPSVRATGARG